MFLYKTELTANNLTFDLDADFELQEEFARLHLDLFLEVLHDHQGDMTVVLTCFNLLNVLSSSCKYLYMQS